MTRSSRSLMACATSMCMARSAIPCTTTGRTRSFMLNRVSPLVNAALQGRFGSDKGSPGVTLAVRHPLSIATIIARKGRAEAVSAAIKQHYGVACPALGRSVRGNGITLHWCGPEQWYAVAEGRSEGALYRELVSRLEGLASCSDQSHGRVILSVS